MDLIVVLTIIASLITIVRFVRYFWRRRRRSMTDPVTNAVLDVIRDTGYTVRVCRLGGQFRVLATHRTSRETFVVTADSMYKAASLLAQKCGVELEDG